MLTKIAVISIATFAFVGCGSSNKDENKAPQTETVAPTTNTADAAVPEAVATDIPDSVVIRVPVDENDEAIGAPELRTLSGSIDLENDGAVAEAFEAASEGANLVTSEDELDGDSSTQSWYCNRGFRGFRGYGTSYRGGYGQFNRGYFSIGFGLRLGYGGQRYGYNYHRGFGVGNGSFRNGIRNRYRYHSYRPHGGRGRW